MSEEKITEALNCATNMQEEAMHSVEEERKNAIQEKFILILFLFTLLQCTSSYFSHFFSLNRVSHFSFHRRPNGG